MKKPSSLSVLSTKGVVSLLLILLTYFFHAVPAEASGVKELRSTGGKPVNCTLIARMCNAGEKPEDTPCGCEERKTTSSGGTSATSSGGKTSSASGGTTTSSGGRTSSTSGGRTSSSGISSSGSVNCKLIARVCNAGEKPEDTRCGCEERNTSSGASGGKGCSPSVIASCTQLRGDLNERCQCIVGNSSGGKTSSTSGATNSSSGGRTSGSSSGVIGTSSGGPRNCSLLICPAGQTKNAETCACEKTKTNTNPSCAPRACPSGQVWSDERCVCDTPDCPTGQKRIYNANGERCVTKAFYDQLEKKLSDMSQAGATPYQYMAAQCELSLSNYSYQSCREKLARLEEQGGGSQPKSGGGSSSSSSSSSGGMPQKCAVESYCRGIVSSSYVYDPVSCACKPARNCDQYQCDGGGKAKQISTGYGNGSILSCECPTVGKTSSSSSSSGACTPRSCDPGYEWDTVFCRCVPTVLSSSSSGGNIPMCPVGYVSKCVPEGTLGGSSSGVTTTSGGSVCPPGMKPTGEYRVGKPSCVQDTCSAMEKSTCMASGGRFQELPDGTCRCLGQVVVSTSGGGSTTSSSSSGAACMPKTCPTGQKWDSTRCACVGEKPNTTSSTSGGGACTPRSCPSGMKWNTELCACKNTPSSTGSSGATGSSGGSSSTGGGASGSSSSSSSGNDLDKICQSGFGWSVSQNKCVPNSNAPCATYNTVAKDCRRFANWFDVENCRCVGPKYPTSCVHPEVLNQSTKQVNIQQPGQGCCPVNRGATGNTSPWVGYDLGKQKCCMGATKGRSAILQPHNSTCTLWEEVL